LGPAVFRAVELPMLILLVGTVPVLTPWYLWLV
jgi:hypothetical protein